MLREANGHIGKAILRLKGKVTGELNRVVDDSRLPSSTIVHVEVTPSTDSLHLIFGFDVLVERVYHVY